MKRKQRKFENKGKCGFAGGNEATTAESAYAFQAPSYFVMGFAEVALVALLVYLSIADNFRFSPPSFIPLSHGPHYRQEDLLQCVFQVFDTESAYLTRPLFS